MKPWKPCEHCYLKDKYCENAERELPCVPVQEHLESGYEIKRLQKKLDIATKALNTVYHDMKCWTFISKRDTRVLSVICEALKEMEEV